MKLPPQVAAVGRESDADLQTSPAGVVPQAFQEKLEGWPNKKGRVHYLHCPSGKAWSLCSASGSPFYECCPTGQSCKDVGGGHWQCHA
jgi:hypothetical protein